MSKALTLKRFKELTADLPEDTPIYYHSYYKGLSLNTYVEKDFWLFPGSIQKKDVRGIVINPGVDYDGPANKKPKTKKRNKQLLESFRFNINRDIKIKWIEGSENDWYYFKIIKVKKDRVKLQGMYDPDRNASHRGDKFYTYPHEIESYEVLTVN